MFHHIRTGGREGGNYLFCRILMLKLSINLWENFEQLGVTKVEDYTVFIKVRVIPLYYASEIWCPSVKLWSTILLSNSLQQ